MKRLVSSIFATISLLMLAATPMMASAASQTWMATISQLPAHTTTHSFNVQYTILSTENQSFTVQLQQSRNEGPFTDCGAAQVTSDDPNPNATNGNSGSVAACVTNDDSYSFRFEVTPAEEQAQTTETTSTIVDTVAPGAPTYLGKTASGGNTIIKFTAPSDQDVTTVNIYAGSTKTYDGDAAHKVATVDVAPGQTYSQTVNASSTMFFALQAFDAAGNGSTIVGDPGTVVNPVVFVNNGGTTSGGTGGGGTGATTTGQVLGLSTGANGASTTGTNQGTANATGSNKTQKSNNNGKVLGLATTNNDNAWQWAGIVIVALFVLGLIYRLFFFSSKP